MGNTELQSDVRFVGVLSALKRDANMNDVSRWRRRRKEGVGGEKETKRQKIERERGK